ncbi:hypothetical protein STRDD11_02627 [Streptococcus sp. DD11]|nr:hypothetical protein STRDD11_02627 [Streptococcus sp. DD11]
MHRPIIQCDIKNLAFNSIYIYHENNPLTPLTILFQPETTAFPTLSSNFFTSGKVSLAHSFAYAIPTPIATVAPNPKLIGLAIIPTEANTTLPPSTKAMAPAVVTVLVISFPQATSAESPNSMSMPTPAIKPIPVLTPLPIALAVPLIEFSAASVAALVAPGVIPMIFPLLKTVEYLFANISALFSIAFLAPTSIILSSAALLIFSTAVVVKIFRNQALITIC